MLLEGPRSRAPASRKLFLQPSSRARRDKMPPRTRQAPRGPGYSGRVVSSGKYLASRSCAHMPGTREAPAAVFCLRSTASCSAAECGGSAFSLARPFLDARLCRRRGHVKPFVAHCSPRFLFPVSRFPRLRTEYYVQCTLQIISRPACLPMI